jgi:hypothetical protein
MNITFQYRNKATSPCVFAKTQKTKRREISNRIRNRTGQKVSEQLKFLKLHKIADFIGNAASQSAPADTEPSQVVKAAELL